MSQRRQWKQSPFYQGVDEQVSYLITVPTSWGTADFSNLANTLYEDPDGTNLDVSSTKLTGSASASSNVITTQRVTGLTDGTKYRLETKFTTSENNVQECWGIIYAQR